LTSGSITRTCGALLFGLAMLTVLATATSMSSSVLASPTAEVAKRCLHYAYIVYPRRRPGAAPASAVREVYFRDCLSKDGEVAEPKPPVKN
jgi:hypothetical protein